MTDLSEREMKKCQIIGPVDFWGLIKVGCSKSPRAPSSLMSNCRVALQVNRCHIHRMGKVKADLSPLILIHFLKKKKMLTEWLFLFVTLWRTLTKPEDSPVGDVIIIWCALTLLCANCPEQKQSPTFEPVWMIVVSLHQRTRNLFSTWKWESVIRWDRRKFTTRCTILLHIKLFSPFQMNQIW